MHSCQTYIIKPRIFIGLYLMIGVLKTNAQGYFISGRVKGDDLKPLVYNVIILSAKDSSIIKGYSFVEEYFKTEKIKPVDIILKISSIGFKSQSLTISGEKASDSISIGNIKLVQDNQLKEIEISALKPLVENINGGSRVNVANTLLEHSASISDLLLKCPNILPSDNGFQYAGKGDVHFYLKGKEIINQRLLTIPIHQIQALEIITNPRAGADAGSEVVVNIVLKKQTIEASNISLKQQLIKAHYINSFSEIDYSYKRKSLLLLANYNYNNEHTWGKEQMSFNSFDRNKESNTANLQFEEPGHFQKHTYLIGSEYTINKRSDISLEYSGETGTEVINQAALTHLNSSSLSDQIISDRNSNTRFLGHYISSNYNFNTDTMGGGYFVGGQISYYREPNQSTINEYFNSGEPDLFTYSQGERLITSNTIQTDYKKRLKRIDIEAGAKYANTNTESFINFYSRNANQSNFNLIENNSNQYHYLENIASSYFQLKGKYRGYEYSTGMRSEFTYSEGVSSVFLSDKRDTSYLNIFLSASIQTTLNKININVSYSSKVNRPRFREVNPFTNYLNSELSSVGNPYLKPQYINTIEASVKWKILNFALGYSYTKYPFAYLVKTKSDSSSSLTFTVQNLQRKDNYYLNASMPFKFWKVEGVNSLSISQKKFNDNKIELFTKSYSPELVLSNNSRLHLNQSTDIENVIRYVSAKSDGLYLMGSYYSWTIGISKKFLENKLSISLQANDLFGMNQRTRSFIIANVSGNAKSTTDTYFYNLTVIYNFGDPKNNYKNKSVGESERERM